MKARLREKQKLFNVVVAAVVIVAVAVVGKSHISLCHSLSKSCANESIRQLGKIMGMDENPAMVKHSIHGE